jgi:hypothetical protein
MANGVIIVPPHDFTHPSRLYYQLKEIKKIRFWIGLTWHNVHKNCMKIRPAILDLIHAYIRASPETTFVKTDDVTKDDAVIAHAQRIMGSCLVIVPLHDSELQRHNLYTNFNKNQSYYMAETVVRKATDRWQNYLLG